VTELHMSESGVAADTTNFNCPVTLVRLVRFRRDDDKSQPSRIYAQVVGNHLDKQVRGIGQAELFQNGEHLILPANAWTCGETVLEALLSKQVPLGDIRQSSSLIDGLIHSVESSISTENEEPAHAAYEVVFRAIKEAFLAFCTEGSLADDELAHLLDGKMRQVSRYFVSPPPPAPIYNGTPANVFSDAPYIEPLPKDGTKGHLLEREALKYGMASTRYPNGAFVVTEPQSQQQMGFKWGRSPLASGVALSICSYKEATRRLLSRVDVPVPNGRVFSIADEVQAIQYADRIGYPVVCKPVAGLRGIGVVANIKNRKELKDALKLYKQSELGADDFVIEEHVPGEDYRIVVIGDQVVASVVRAPASVTGDGVHTVADLIEHKNQARQANPHLSSRPIKLSESLEYQLELSGLTYSSVPTRGQVVLLANSANLSQGGDSFEIADELHPSIKELSVRAVQAVPGLGFCGLDMLIEDHTKPVWEQQVTVIELNAHAAIGSAQYPMWGTPAPVAKEFFEATCANADIPLPPAQNERLSIELSIRGRVTGVGYRQWLKRKAVRFGLTGFVRNHGKSGVQAHIEGNSDAVAALGYLAMTGPHRAVPTSVTMRHVGGLHRSTFEIIPDPFKVRAVRKTRRIVSRIRRKVRRTLRRGTQKGRSLARRRLRADEESSRQRRGPA
jgi:D-alanine-D-alanine ligase-like ATP-grasp enzyme/acylphosphatase